MALSQLKEFCVAEDATALDACIARYGDNALILGGGSFIHGLEARGLLSEVEALVDISRLGLDGTESSSSGLRLGATATYAQVERLAEVRSAPWLGAVRDALTYPPLQIRNVATVGGCLAAACPFFDLPTAFLALDGRVSLSRAGSIREIGLAELSTGLFENCLESGELITALQLPMLPARSASAFLKLETTANDLALVNVAVRLSLDAGGYCREARVVLGGGVGDRITRAVSAERVLQGQRLDGDVLQSAAEAVGADISPMEDHRASAAYRMAMAKVFTKRALEKALDRLNRGGAA